MEQGLQLSQAIQRAVNYIVQGLVVAVVAYYIPRRRMNIEEIAVISLTGAATFAVLDLMAPSIGEYTRKGVGFGIGTGMVGGPTLQ